MSTAKSRIEWTDRTWNPVRGCSLVSPGCTNCYAMKQAHRFSGAGKAYEGLTRRRTRLGPVWTGDIRLVHEALAEPLRWRGSSRVFVNSMSDLFHDEVPDDFVDRVFGVMAACRSLGPDAAPGHTFQVLTKRAERMRDYLSVDRREAWARHAATLGGAHGEDAMYDAVASWRGPLPNVHLGVSIEDQQHGLPRIEHLRAIDPGCDCTVLHGVQVLLALALDERVIPERDAGAAIDLVRFLELLQAERRDALGLDRHTTDGPLALRADLAVPVVQVHVRPARVWMPLDTVMKLLDADEPSHGGGRA